MSFPPEALGTPLVRLSRYAPGADLYGKVELMLPTGSAYDRIAGRLVAEAGDEALVVAASGSAALAFAGAATAQAKTLTAVIPAATLAEHRELLSRYPVRVVTVDGDLEAVHAAAERIEGRLVFSLGTEGAAREAFAATLGAELGEMLPPDPRVTVLVAPLGTGALLFGTADGLRAAGHAVETVGAVRPAGESVQDGLVSRATAPEGASRLVEVSDAEAHEGRLLLARSEGILVGMGSAAAAVAAKREAANDRRVVVILVDAGDRYFSVDRKFGG